MIFLPSANEVWGKVKFLQVVVCPRAGPLFRGSLAGAFLEQRSPGQRPLPWTKTPPLNRDPSSEQRPLPAVEYLIEVVMLAQFIRVPLLRDASNFASK